MTYALVTVTGDDLTLTPDADGALEASTLELDGVHAAFPAEDGYVECCTACGDQLEEEGGQWVDVDQRGDVCPSTGGAHTPERGPGSWCNGAGISVSEEENCVTVRISVADPRGALVMTVRRRPDTGELLLHLPHPGDAAPHVALTELHPGTYRIG